MKNFIYFIDLENPVLSWNLAQTNVLQTASLLRLSGFPEEYSLYTTDPEKLLTDCECLKFGAIAPRLQYLLLSCWERKGLKIGIGVNNTRFFSQPEIERIHKVAKLEVEFEKIRRLINTNLPSRLSCLFLAEDDFNGRVMLQNMFSHKKTFHIAPVKITICNRLFRADSKWIDEYASTHDQKTIENYWNGAIFDNNPQFEFLLEGQIALKEIKDRQYIETYRVKV